MIPRHAETGTTALEPGPAPGTGIKLLFLHGLNHLSIFLRGSGWKLKELHLKQSACPRSSFWVRQLLKDQLQRSLRLSGPSTVITTNSCTTAYPWSHSAHITALEGKLFSRWGKRLRNVNLFARVTYLGVAELVVSKLCQGYRHDWRQYMKNSPTTDL